MSTLQKVAVIIALTGLATALVLPGRTTASVVTAGGNALSGWSRAVEGQAK